eukprot:GHVU01105301.1.p1 GENE.GHVU01105301.1~~GHVU01105301.1.p1  ORF type:complete len:110 (-),score=11.16 GHVU01105301.1:151-480(-)
MAKARWKHGSFFRKERSRTKPHLQSVVVIFPRVCASMFMCVCVCTCLFGNAYRIRLPDQARLGVRVVDEEASVVTMRRTGETAAACGKRVGVRLRAEAGHDMDDERRGR